jgi:starvation-inducible DNA-binding protein
VDEIDERIRSLGHFAPGSYGAYSKLSSIQEDAGVPPAKDMILNLVKGHEAVARTAREIFVLANGANDQPTCDLLTQRMQVSEKTAWMLRSLIETGAA